MESRKPSKSYSHLIDRYVDQTETLILQMFSVHILLTCSFFVIISATVFSSADALPRREIQSDVQLNNILMEILVMSCEYLYLSASLSLSLVCGATYPSKMMSPDAWCVLPLTIGACVRDGIYGNLSPKTKIAPRQLSPSTSSVQQQKQSPREM